MYAFAAPHHCAFVAHINAALFLPFVPLWSSADMQYSGTKTCVPCSTKSAFGRQFRHVQKIQHTTPPVHTQHVLTQHALS
eukprot:1147009-Pelagomonas_calceolata.AAC.4